MSSRSRSNPLALAVLACLSERPMQYLEEADQLAARVVIIDGGRVVADGSPAVLKTRAGHDVVELHVADAASLAVSSDLLEGVVGVRPHVDSATRACSISTPDGPAVLHATLRALDDVGAHVEGLGLRRPTLGEVFLALTGRDGAAHDSDRQPSADERLEGTRS